MIRLAAIDNLSGAAYRLCRPGFEHRLVFGTPARVASLLRTGQCDAALLPTGALPELKGAAKALGPYGIACTGRVRSVQLFTEVPLEQLAYERLPVYVTPESRTSARLLRILWGEQFGDSPRTTPVEDEARARLLIGDRAIEYAATIPQPAGIDLGDWWLRQTGLPFVFARWVYTDALGADTRVQIRAWLDACVTAAASPDGIETLAAAGATTVDAAFLRGYYKHVRPGLTYVDQAAQNRFIQLMESERHATVAPVS